MLKANELRIGNYITYNSLLQKDEVFIVDQRWFGALAGGRRKGEIKPDEEIINYSGIPLTPEILERCGFANIYMANIWNVYIKGKYRIEETARKNSYAFRLNVNPNESYYLADVNYLHQLQNLYFSLTGEELEIKELQTANK